MINMSKSNSNKKRKFDINTYPQNKRGKTSEDQYTKKKDVEDSSLESSASFCGFLKDVEVFILPAGIEKARLEIFKSQISKNGGKCTAVYNSDSTSLTHVIVSEKMDIDRALRIMKVDSSNQPQVPIVKSIWLSFCLKNKCLLPSDEYELKANPSVISCKSSNNDSKANSNAFNEVHEIMKIKVKIDSDEDEDVYIKTGQPTTSGFENLKPFPVEKWICAQSSNNSKQNFNSHITDKLEEMVKAYQNSNDKWRSFGYQKAIQALRRHPKEISSWEEAMSLQGIGKRLADKIWEIAQSGELRKLRQLKSSEDVKILELFNNVWGAGPTTAQQWYQQGFRSIEDLKEKAHLTSQQRVGVRLFNDLLDRMPREEASEIEKIVRDTAQSLVPGVLAQACGSYRRGKATCGDVDVLVTHPDGRSHIGLFSRLLANLRESGFITDDLVTAEESGNQKKYLGVCRLAGESRKHRRLDIIVVPYCEFACALMYFTGSAHFNRSLRHLCKKQHMSLNEHALKSGVIRKGSEKIHEGNVIPTPTERSVFEALNLPYRPPEERDH